MKTENQNNKISDLHFDKLQESNKKQHAINAKAAELFQHEFELKNYKMLLEQENGEYILERQKLLKELSDVYGNVSINPGTGEYELK